MNRKMLEARIARLENLLLNKNKKFENMQLSVFDCESLADMISNQLKDLRQCEVDYTDDNADYGFLNIGIYNPEYVTGYDIVANDFDSFEVTDENDSRVGIANSFKRVAELIADHFRDNYV